MPTVVQVPTTVQQLDQVRSLMRSFITWHKERHREDIHLIEAYFDAEAFEDELASLPGKYVPPHGQLLLATSDGTPAGCVALREIDSVACEMKRMFVYTQFHGKGVGRALAEVLIKEARGLGYRAMRLDTSIRQAEAMGLYQHLGFRFVEPYDDVPETMRDWLVFMELVLWPRRMSITASRLSMCSVKTPSNPFVFPRAPLRASRSSDSKALRCRVATHHWTGLHWSAPAGMRLQPASAQQSLHRNRMKDARRTPFVRRDHPSGVFST